MRYITCGLFAMLCYCYVWSLLSVRCTLCVVSFQRHVTITCGVPICVMWQVCVVSVQRNRTIVSLLLWAKCVQYFGLRLWCPVCVISFHCNVTIMYGPFSVQCDHCECSMLSAMWPLFAVFSYCNVCVVTSQWNVTIMTSSQDNMIITCRLLSVYCHHFMRSVLSIMWTLPVVSLQCIVTIIYGLSWI